MAHLVLTGPITGSVRLEDGTVVDVSPELVEAVSFEQAAEIAHRIALWHVENGHPDDVELDVDGARVQRPFEYDDSHFRKVKRTKKKGR